MINGSGNKGEFTIVDIISLLSFLIGIENLNANLTQNDKAVLQSDLAKRSDDMLKEIHQHLETQDRKLDLILRKFGDNNER